MKPFLGIDITENKKNEHFNGDEFVVERTPSSQVDALDNSFEEMTQEIEKAKAPLPIRIVCYICGAVAILVGGVTLRVLGGEEGITLSEAYANAPWLFWIAGICLVIWVGLKLITRKNDKAVKEVIDDDERSARIDSLVNTIYAQFGVPADAQDVDILSFHYKLKNGQPVAKEVGLSTTPYLNLSNKVFVKDGSLYIVDRESKYEFPISSLKRITTVKKHITVPLWSKDIPCNEEIYKPYKMSETNTGDVAFKNYHILEVMYNDELWGIYFPCYELPVFEKLTGLTAEE